MNNLNQLNYPTLTGLKSLELDKLTAVTLNSDTFDGNIIEGNNIIVDTTLSLTNTGVISVGGYKISDIELTYLDGVTSNIQTQINSINTNNSNLSNQIYGLQLTDLSHNILLSQHTNQIYWLQLTDLSIEITYKAGYENNNFTNLPDDIKTCLAQLSARNFDTIKEVCNELYDLDIMSVYDDYKKHNINRFIFFN